MKQTRLTRAWLAWLQLPLGIRPGVVAVILIVVIAALLAVWPRQSHAAEQGVMIARNGPNIVLMLWDSPCVHGETLARINPANRDKYRKARATIDGYAFFGCWRVDGENVRVIYEDGDQGLVPLSDFKLDEGA